MTKHFHRLACATLLLGSAMSSYAEKVSLEEALGIANEFMSMRTGKNQDLLKLTAAPTQSAQPLYYVFNADNNGGFVIVSAESSANPVLGYSFEGAYLDNALPDAMKWMMSGLEREIKAAPAEQNVCSVSEFKNMARKAARAAGTQKLLNTPSWSQEAPFNNLIPGNPLVGCVGTAMATVMKYHGFPQSGKGSFDGVEFNTTYDWESMRTDNYRSGYSAAEADAVATLMYHASKSIDTQYAMSGSSAYEVRVPAALSTYFGYDPGVSYKKRADVATQQAWDQIVRNEIDEGRPVIYCGQDVTAGHAFVCDGYQGDYLHFNWGWGGSANGYFLSTALNPTVSRQHHYNNLNTIIYNIKPGSGSVSEWSPIHITADGNQPGLGSDLTNLSSGNAFTVRAGNLKNLSYNDFSGKIAVALCSGDGSMKALLSSPASFSLQSMATLYNGFIDFNNCRLPDGTPVAADDCVRIVTQANGQTEWLPVAGELPTVNELAVQISSPASFAVTLPAGVSGVSISGNNSVIKGWNYSFNVVPQNADENVVTVKANGYVLTPGNGYSYTIANVREDQNITVLVQKASEVRAKRSIWVESPGTLSDLIPESETGTIRELSIFGSIDARDFAFMRNNMRLEKVDLSGAYIAAHGTDQANAIPREAFRGIGSLREVILPKSVNRLNNGCFRQTGITSITIPAGVKTYEYNVFVAASRLQDIYVGRESAEFINWCVLSGVKVATATLHVPNERAVANYRNAENWNTIQNIIVDPIVESDDVLFAVMDDASVKYDSDNIAGRMAKGSKITFKAEYIPENDNQMEVYANSTLLTPDANGVYSTSLTANTIIHFNIVGPTQVDSQNSPWSLTAKGGSVGMLTDAVNVIPGQEFQVRVNTLNIPQYYDQFFWAIALTDDNGNIKEFISPVNLWTAGAGDSHKFSVNCCVKDSKVREGNMLRLVTSGNKRNWNIVKASGKDIVDALPALNNQTPVYNITMSEVKGATVTGVPETAVRGRDITIKVTPNSAAHRIDFSINGRPIAQGAASINYTHVVMEDAEININVYDPKAEGSYTYNVKPGELYKAVTASNVAANVIVVGEVYSKDLALAFRQDFAAKTIKRLDLSNVTIVADVLTPTSDDDKIADYIPANLLYNPSGVNPVKPVVEEIILPNSVTRIGSGAFSNCYKLKEIRLPEALVADRLVVGAYPSGSPKYGWPIGAGAFQGCESLTTIYIPGALKTVNGRLVVCHFTPYSTAYSNLEQEPSYNLGHKVGDVYDASQTTIVVPEEYLNAYRTAYSSADYGNPWQKLGYNIVAENPVYGVNYDSSRITTVEKDYDITKMASFLGGNVSLNTIKVEKKLKLINPETSALIYDNGEPVQADADGYISVEFLNPAKNTTGVGNHNIEVINTYDLAFNTTSSLFTISEPEVINEMEYKSGAFDRSDALAPVLRNVAENSTVNFRLQYASEHADAIETHVLAGQQEIIADADGTYAIDITNAGKTIEIFAVPTDGATLNATEIASLNPEQTEGITNISLTGNITPEDLAQAISCFPSVENLDLSDMEGELAEGAFSGMTALTTVSLPEIEEINSNMFNGCSSLQSIDIPASVNSIGESAFKDCKSLESISLTGISSIGNDAFNGCDNLTTITLLADVAAKPQNARSRLVKAATLSNEAFNGLNPNCFIILDEGVTIPAADVNVLRTTSGMISEIQPDGSTVEREGRTYSASSDIMLRSTYPLSIPHAFSLENDSKISFSTVNEGWGSLVIPFDATSIKDAEGKDIEISIATGEESSEDCNYIFALGNDAENLSSVKMITANTPALFHTPEKAEYIFSTSEGKVPATPSDISANGKDFSLHALYSTVELPASRTYLLNSSATAFIPAGNDDETISLKPFEIYATSPAEVSEIPVDLPDSGVTVGIESIDKAVDKLTITSEGDQIVIYSPDERTETICDVEGRVIRSVYLKAGRNVIDLNLTGIFIIANTKIRL